MNEIHYKLPDGNSPSDEIVQIRRSPKRGSMVRLRSTRRQKAATLPDRPYYMG